MSKLSRRAFMGASAATIVSIMVPASRAYGQALPVWNATPAITTGGRMAVSSITLNGSTTALSIGDRVILSRAATQVAAKAATRAVANRTMGLIATRMLGAAAVAGPWGLAAAGLGVVAYGAYRYFTADDEASPESARYSVQYGQGTGLATVQATLSASGTPCDGLLRGGNYPSSTQAETAPLGLFNGSSGCLPYNRMKMVFNCTATELAGLSTSPSGWSKAHTYTAVTRPSGVNEYWVYYTQPVGGSASAGYTPSTYPAAQPATVPAALPADTRVKVPGAQAMADIANAAWQQAVSSSDASALPWSAANAATATAALPAIKPGAATVAEPSPGTLGDLAVPRPAVTPDAEVAFTYPPEVVFPDDGAATNPGTDPTPTPTPTPGTTPTPTPSTGIDWGTPPEGSIPGAPTAFSWIPTPWAAPSLPGSCTGLPYNFTAVFRGASGSINPCPVIDQARPVLRPVAVAGWTVYAVTQFLDL